MSEAVCRSVREKMNHFVKSFRVQNVKVGKKMREGNCRKEKRENAERELRFEGLEFLLTGLSKNKKNKLEALIRKHGGIVLSSLPPLSNARVRGIQKTQRLGRKCPIIISAQQVGQFFNCRTYRCFVKFSFLIAELIAVL
jgi:hypothetical protein